RQLGEESDGDAHHELLQGKWTEICPTMRDRLIGLHRELADAPFEVDVFEDAHYRARCDGRLTGRHRAELRAHSLQLTHLLVEIDPALLLRHRNSSKTLSLLLAYEHTGIRAYGHPGASLTNQPP